MGRTQLPHEGRQHNQNGLEGQGARPVRDVLQLQHVVGRHIQSGLRRCVHIRAIVFGETDEFPVDELKHCISLALTYHRVKHLPLLGA